MTNLALSFSNIQDRIKKRTALEKYLICLLILFVLAVVGLIIALASFPKTAESLVCETSACYAAGSAIRDSLDLNADPCTDFYSYCCGGWEKSHEIPQDMNKYGAIGSLQINVLSKLKGLFENNKYDGIAVQNAVRFYESCTNMSSIENHGISPLIKFLGFIGGWPVIETNWSERSFSWLSASAKIQLKTGYGHILPIIVATDPKNTSRRLLQIDQPSLLISDDILRGTNKEYSEKELKNFKVLFSKIATLLGAKKSNFDVDFNSIIELERNMLQMMSTKDQMNNFTYWYNVMKVSELQQKIPKIDWLWYLQELTNSSLLSLEKGPVIQDNDIIIVRDLPYVKKLSSYVISADNSRQISTYLGYRAIMILMLHLPQKFSKVLEEYYSDSGYSIQTPERWKVCLNRINAAFSEVASFLYVQKYFPADVKNEVMKLILDLRFQFETLLLNNDWMDRLTKNAALKKLRAMEVNVGYPDWIVDEKNLDDFYVKNNMPEMNNNVFEDDLKLTEHRTMQIIQSLRIDLLKEEWSMSPITINAAYNRNLNSITFPAAFLQSPIYNSDLPGYINYATIGSIIGHEITHGFDSEGSKRDASGDIYNWWSSETKELFKNKTDCFIKQYDQYGLNGKQTLAENIADNGGLRQAYAAFKSWNAKQLASMKLPGLEKFSSDQVFFLAYGSIWCTKYAPGVLNYTIREADHAPSPCRLKITSSNLKGFSEAFSCDKKDLDFENMCSVW